MVVLFKVISITVLFLCVAKASVDYKIACYFSNWSQYRRSPYSFTADDIDPKLCTHLILAFAKINERTMGLEFIEYNDDITYSKLQNIKLQNPEVKVMVAVGGYGTHSVPFSKMTSLPEYREQFINQSIDFLTSFGFDGLDLDWEYPTLQTIPNGLTILEEKGLFAQLLEEMRYPYTETGLLISAAVSAGIWLIDQAYDVPALNKYLDFVLLMSYDFNGPWSKKTGHPSPLWSNDNLNTNSAADYWVSKGLHKSKLVVGLSTFARSFSLADKYNIELGAPIIGAGTHGQYTGEPGILAYYEICEALADPNSAYRIHWLDDQGVPYMEDGNNWIGYENEDSIKLKVDWIKESQFAGAMLWSLDFDDFPGQCATSIVRYPLVSLVHNALKAEPGSPGEPCLMAEGLEEHYCSDHNADCNKSDLVCECKTGYMEHRKRCKRVATPGSSCMHAVDLCSGGSSCHRDSQTCVCIGAYFDLNRKCLPQSRLYEECVPEESGASCVGELTTCLITGKCGCIANTSDLSGSAVCIPDKQTGGVCNPNEIKPCDKFVDQCICSDGTCKCTKFEFCQNRRDGYYVDPDDCRKYYRCVSKVTYHLSCSEGLFWDNDLTVCAFNPKHCGKEASLPPTLTPPQSTTSSGKTMTTVTLTTTGIETTITGEDRVPATTDASTKSRGDTNGTQQSTEGLHNATGVSPNFDPVNIGVDCNRSASFQCARYVLSVVALFGKFVIYVNF